MGIIFVIVGIVLFVSLYDYFTSRSWQQVTSTTRNDIVFSDRNKEFGAYEIRKNYDRNLILILFGVVATIGLVYGTYLFIKSLPEEEVELPPVDTTLFTIEAPPLDEEVPPPPPIEEEIPVQMEKTVEFLPPVVTDEQVDTPPPIQEAMTDTKASTTTNDKETETFLPPPVQEKKQVEEKEEILTFVAEEASFPGGTAEMMKYLAKNIKYPEVAIQAGIQGKVTLRFVVGKDGNIENVTVARGVPGCPECDKEAVRVVKSMPNWKPAKNDGKVVKSYFNLPVTFKLQ
ncbi:MAG TPA: TonB family protein [Taishania sp.]|nr:TonB family protein [Taishania sp.]